MRQATTGQTAHIIGMSPATIISWGKEFAEFLSEGANPDKGEQREFSAEDIAIFKTVATLRAQRQSYETIRERLEQGERLEPIVEPTEQPQQETETNPTETETSALVAFNSALKAQENQIVSLQGKVGELISQLLEVTERAARAEGKLEQVESQEKQRERELELLQERARKAQQELEELQQRGFFERLFNR